MATTRKAFLDANVLRGQLTTDIMMTLAHERLYQPKWSPEATVLVTENVKDFDPPTSGPRAMPVQKLSPFLNQLADDDPAAPEARKATPDGPERSTKKEL